jgi:hypothetical protein
MAVAPVLMKTIDGFEVQGRAVEMTSGRCSPVFAIFWGGDLVHQQEFPSPGEDFASYPAAAQAALARAAQWVSDHPITVFYSKPKFTEMPLKLAEQGPFKGVDAARTAPFPEGYSEAHFKIGIQQHSFRPPRQWEVALDSPST